MHTVNVYNTALLSAFAGERGATIRQHARLAWFQGEWFFARTKSDARVHGHLSHMTILTNCFRASED